MKSISQSQISKFILIFSLLSISSLFSETILLKNGKIQKAKVVDQEPLNIIIEKEDKTREAIPKNQILKVIFKQTTDEEAEKIQLEEMKKLEDKRLAKLKKEQEERAKYLEELNQKKIKEEKDKAALVDTKKSLLSSLTTNNFYSPINSTVILANSSAICTPLKSKKQWFVLFGSVPLNTIKPEDMFDSNGSYKVYFKSTVIDTIASVLLGLTTSITLKTMFVENCSSNSEPVIVLQKAELEALLNKNKESAAEEIQKEIEEDNIKFKK